MIVWYSHIDIGPSRGSTLKWQINGGGGSQETGGLEKLPNFNKREGQNKRGLEL